MPEIALKLKSDKFSLLKNRNFLLLYFGGIVSWLGNSIYYIALSWHVLEKYGSGFVLGTVLMFGSLPGIVFGPFSGVIVDRFDRRNMVVLMDIIRGVVILVMTYLLFVDKLSYMLLVAGTVIISISESFFDPAVSALLPNLVENDELMQANSLKNLASNLTSITGLALGGILIGFIGVTGVFLLNGISFLISAVSEIFIKVSKTEEEEDINSYKNSFLNEFVFGLKFIFTNKFLLSLCMAVIFLNFFFIGSIGVALPFIVKEVMGLGEVQFGIIESVFPAGGMLGALVITLLPKTNKYSKLVIGGLLSHGLLLFFIGIIVKPSIIVFFTVNIAFWAMAGLIFLMGIANAFLNVPMITLFQKIVPDEVRGRFFGFFSTFTQGLVPVAYFISGILLDVFSPYILIIIGSLAITILSLKMSRIEGFKNI
ncbi:hypothetical protein BBF96_02395 [Anoxybacter fermentans]|uniref:Major facilitator superfamily (MFS) profile domain-containing protein n=1 Tax=Anoxybacter fermentans TaxID=1323375 RepID=A0A3Q9HNY6_9FIRM|nr:MFS transporter [Anoxybacter fermentans]AZR72340.1 hypothetical protein BBF96_02395 [Anoxybacter fermentans]